MDYTLEFTHMTEYVSMKEDVLKLFQENLSEIRKRFGVELLGILGSVARGEDTKDSDVDVLYKFAEGKATLYNLIDLQEYLESLFGRSVDLVSVEFIDPSIEVYVKKDAVVYEAALA